ncbi:MAG TPA: GLPGLI family protein, partial [Daejeonella sp.]|nr:GLPGLI family protein [Daejeonella sp.]
MLLKRILPITFLLTLIFNYSNGQTKAIAEIIYEQKIAYQDDSGSPKRYSISESLLLLSKSSSLYSKSSAKTIVKDVDNGSVSKAALNKSLERNLSAFQSRAGNLMIKDYNSGFLTEQRITQEEEVFLIRDTLKAINWTIQDNKKIIAGYECQKALGTFRGRNYEAWFTTAIPLSSGPWKLNGLPGLILEATDDKNEVSFSLLSIHIPPKSNTTFPDKLTGVEISKKAYTEKNNLAAEKRLS